MLRSDVAAPRFSSAGPEMAGLPEEAFVVDTELERDLAAFASRLARYRQAGASEAMCESALRRTGLCLVKIADVAADGVSLPIAGAVVSGVLSIDYFAPRRRPGVLQRPVLSKMICEGSSFYISSDTDAVLAASPGAWLVVRNEPVWRGRNLAELKLSKKPSIDLSGLSHADLLAQIDKIEFDDVSALVATARPVLAEIASRRDLLRGLFSNVRADPKLRNSCELLNDFYKYVLHRAANDTRLRLHLFRPDAYVSPHAHRWSMVSYVLSGPCSNKYYGLEGELAALPRSVFEQASITHRLQTGACYAFDDTLVHWFQGAPGAATLTLRGPAVKPKATQFRTGGLTAKFGIEADVEPSQTMTPEQFEHGVRRLELTNVL